MLLVQVLCVLFLIGTIKDIVLLLTYRTVRLSV